MPEAKFLHGRRFGQMLCEALDLDQNTVRQMTIIASLDDAAVVVVEHLVTNDQAKKTGEILVKRYRLVDIEEGED